MSKDPSCYIVSYRDPKDGAIVSLKVKSISDSTLGLSFIALSGFIFDSSAILVNPEEEAMKKKFENIKTLHLSIYSIISIAEMGLETPRLAFKNDKSNLFVLPQSPNPE
ncbi:MAG: DUF1820 family protein [Bdellovibrionaceae bacterium]|nr:DUF1820 family protein [Pseudobdellovibrionaceae bacterium]